MELFLIRHAQSANNARGDAERVEDPQLTALGLRQAAAVAARVGELELTRLITSPFRRTLQTAEFICEVTGLTPHVWVELHEQGGCVSGPDEASFRGRPGMTDAQIRREFPAARLPVEIDHEGWWKGRPYESVDEARARAVALTRRTRDEFAHTGERVVYVTHGGFGQILAVAMEGSDTANDAIGELNNAAVARIEVSPAATRLVSYNEVDHLSFGMVT